MADKLLRCFCWQDMFHDIFSGGAAQGEGAETFYKESTADKLKKQMDRAKKHSQKLRLKLATKVCEPKWMPETVRIERIVFPPAPPWRSLICVCVITLTLDTIPSRCKIRPHASCCSGKTCRRSRCRQQKLKTKSRRPYTTSAWMSWRQLRSSECSSGEGRWDVWS